MRALITLLILGLAGCSTEPVACDAHLTPINPVAKPSPASNVKPDAVTPTPGERQGSGR
jgi:hypothetical protein